jgi:hypothetical protein
MPSALDLIPLEVLLCCNNTVGLSLLIILCIAKKKIAAIGEQNGMLSLGLYGVVIFQKCCTADRMDI